MNLERPHTLLITDDWSATLDRDQAVQRIQSHYAAAGVNERRVAEDYAEDAVLDFPQGGERIAGRHRILAVRSAYPAQVRLVPRRITGSGDVWVIASTITYDAVPQYAISVWELRGDEIVHETVYVTQGWDPPAWRGAWVEPIPGYDDQAG